MLVSKNKFIYYAITSSIILILTGCDFATPNTPTLTVTSISIPTQAHTPTNTPIPTYKITLSIDELICRDAEEDGAFFAATKEDAIYLIYSLIQVDTTNHRVDTEFRTWGVQTATAGMSFDSLDFEIISMEIPVGHSIAVDMALYETDNLEAAMNFLEGLRGVADELGDDLEGNSFQPAADVTEYFGAVVEAFAGVGVEATELIEAHRKDTLLGQSGIDRNTIKSNELAIIFGQQEPRLYSSIFKKDPSIGWPYAHHYVIDYSITVS